MTASTKTISAFLLVFFFDEGNAGLFFPDPITFQKNIFRSYHWIRILFCLYWRKAVLFLFIFFSVRVVKSEQISRRVRSIATKSTCLLTTAAFVVPCILFCFNFNKWWKVFRLLIAWASLPSMECGAEVGGRKTFFYIYFQYLKDPWRALHVCFTFVKTFSWKKSCNNEKQNQPV